jgi:hypothetical protein
MIALAANPNPPRHLVLGAFGFDAVLQRLRRRVEEIESQREVSLAADFPKN